MGLDNFGRSDAPSGTFALPKGQGEVRTIFSDGRRVTYQRSGAGDTALVLVHGGLCDRSFWHLQVSGLADAWQILAVDLSGHGASAGLLPDDGIGGMANDIARVVADAGAPRVVLVGHSFGALVAIEAAKQVDQGVLGVVVVDLLHDGQFTPPPRAPLGPDGVRGAMRQGMFKPNSNAAERERILDAMTGGSPAIAMALQAEAMTYDATAALRATKAVPVSMIFGGMRPVDAAAIRRIRPDARLFSLADAGHFVMLDAAAAFNDLLATEARLMIGAVQKL